MEREEALEPWQDGPYARFTELVPVATVRQYREYTWRRGRCRLTPAEWDALAIDIVRAGFREPLVLLFNPANSHALLGEGNHRLAIAEELGLTHVPVRVCRSSMPRPEHPGSRRVEGCRIPPTTGYVPGDLRPSQVFPPDCL